MRVLRFDCVGGASGDMILGALVGLGIAPSLLEKELGKVIPEYFRLKIEKKTSFGASGVYLTVNIDEHRFNVNYNCNDKHTYVSKEVRKHDLIYDKIGGEDTDDVNEYEKFSSEPCGEHGAFHPKFHGRTYLDICRLLEKSNLNEQTKKYSLQAFNILAKAEAEVHSVAIDDVHFHEVGAVDSIIDTVGCILGLNFLNVDGISLSPLPIGEGTFHCCHGIYPLPAPATAILLRDYKLPVSLDVEQCEMLTPTATALFAVWNKVEIPFGAKILAVVNSFGTREMKTRPNLLRATLYETDNSNLKVLSMPPDYEVETVYELETNVDDATGERLATVAVALFNTGALDVWFEPIQMKKGRPASRLCVLVKGKKRNEVLDVIFRHSGVFGVREIEKKRYSLSRCWKEVKTQWGIVKIKLGTKQNGELLSIAPEFDDVLTLAVNNAIPFERVYREAMNCYSLLEK